MWSAGYGKPIKIHEDKWVSAGLTGGPANREEPQIEYATTEKDLPETNRWNEQKLNELSDEETVKENPRYPTQPNPEGR